MTNPMKQRLVVMNAQKILQQKNDDDKWENVGTIKAAGAGIKAGIYNLFSALPVRSGETYEGQILHIDKKEGLIFQKTRFNYICFDINDSLRELKEGQYYSIKKTDDHTELKAIEPVKKTLKLKL